VFVVWEGLELKSSKDVPVNQTGIYSPMFVWNWPGALH